MNVTSGYVDAGNVELRGVFDFSNLEDIGDAFDGDFLMINWDGEIQSVYDLWLEDIEIEWIYQFNIPKEFDEETSTWEDVAFVLQENGDAIRNIKIGGEFRITSVNEPGVLAMFGLGLCLLGVRYRRQRH